MIIVQALLTAGVAAEDFRFCVLDGRTAYTVRLSCEEPTTCVFPGPLAALEGANVSARAEDQPPVLLSHRDGTNYFSLRAMKENARAALNVVYQGRVFPITFETGKEPDRAVVFQEPAPPPSPAAPPASPQAVRALMVRARNHRLIEQQYPTLAQAVARAEPQTRTEYPGFTVVLAELFRFDAEDVLVFKVRLDNGSSHPIRFDPSGVAVRVGQLVCPATLVEGTGEVPARSSATVWFALAGDGRGARAELSLNNTFIVLVPTLP